MGQRAFTEESVAIWQGQCGVLGIYQLVCLERFTFSEKPSINSGNNLREQ
jgi:hypothetical protein